MGIRLLLVDDDPGFRETLRYLLAQRDEVVILAEAGNDEEALGLAPAILANGGVVKRKRVAADTSVAALLRRKEAQFTAQPLEVDDKLVTAAGGKYAEHFGNAILKALQK